MNYSSVVRILALLHLVLAASAIPSVLIALAAEEPAQVLSFSVLIVSTSVIASSVLLLAPKPRLKSRPSDALGVVILWWLLAPLASALPFAYGVAGSSFVDSVHEATSCLTTTGHTVLSLPIQDWPVSLIVWRGTLHAFGGLVTVVTAASVFAAINLGGPGIHRTVLFSVPETSFFDAVPKVVRVVLMLSAVSLLTMFSALILVGESVPRAIGDSVSVLTTGLVLPDSSHMPPVSKSAAVVLGAGLVVGTLGLAVLLPLKDGKPLTAILDPETVMLGLLVGIFILLALPLGLDLREALAWAVTGLATSGLALTDAPLDQIVPLPVLVLPALVGGSALSAAGGVKLARLIVLFRRALQEFRQLGFRKSILGFRFRDRELDERSVIGVWVYLIAYILTVFIVLLSLSFLGQPFEAGIRLAIGCLTNSGALTVGHVDELTPGASAVSVLAMILGRLEILALIPALSVSFWRG